MGKEEEILQLANLFSGKLSGFLIDAVKEYVDHGENKLALEMLCDFLADNNVILNEFEYQEIIRLGVLLNLNVNDMRFAYLKTLILL
ncbi:MafI family immunity protein [Comamonas odontotermitis]|uniref:MafI family immunity protein n=1 Tax=Comamonas odontotermitis TaxID=379895 RepID=UPI003753D73E